MQKYNKKIQLCFDDILLVPQYTDVKSRKDVDLTMPIGGNSWLSLPVIASPMDTVCESEMAISLAKAGGVGIIHRFMSDRQQLINVLRASTNNFEGGNLAVGVALGINFTKEHVESLILCGATLLLIDTANGHSRQAINATKRLKDIAGDRVHIMSGNVSTAEGYVELAYAGADSVRVGIGGGSACTTRLVSGHGIPTLSSVIMAAEAKQELQLQTGIIADGGIRTTGDMVKSFAAGADAVMLGSMLAGTEESPGSVMINEFGKYKTYRGMASAEANEGKNIAVAEGVSTTVAYKGPVAGILTDIRGGLGSGCSYSGTEFLHNLYEYAMYIEVSSNSLQESKPHAKN